MKKFFFLMILFSAPLLLSSCGKDSDDADDNGGKELVQYLNTPVPGMGVVKKMNVSKGDLPSWLVEMIDEWESSRTPIEIPIVFKGEWMGKKTIYYCYNVSASCLFCDVYFADGSEFDWSVYDEESMVNYLQVTENWCRVYVNENYPDDILKWVTQ